MKALHSRVQSSITVMIGAAAMIGELIRYEVKQRSFGASDIGARVPDRPLAVPIATYR